MTSQVRPDAPGDIGGHGTHGDEPRPSAPPDPIKLRPADFPGWAHENLFSSWLNSILTIVFGVFVAWLAYRSIVFVLVSSDWTIIEVNLTNFMVGRFPRGQLAYLWGAIYLLAAVVGLTAGVSVANRTRETRSWRGAAGRYVPPAVLILVLLGFSNTLLPSLLTVGALAVTAAGYWAGRLAPPVVGRRIWVVAVLGLVAAYFVARTGGTTYAGWGGMLLTLFFAAGAITLSFPFGLLLALGRRSSFPAVRLVCVGYIELIRGVPLIALLFMGAFMLGFFYPDFIPKPGKVTAALIAMILFTAAYVAEIVRGGLQSVPQGQIEAARAVGLSPLKITRLIVLPQALRAVIPAIVGQFISLFKDTSLVSIIGLLELLGVARVVTQQPDFLAQGLDAQTLAFAGFVYWVFCYSMSRASQRLEQRLGVGER
ncbi:MAG: ABC transporter permease subunit [Nitriliruptorales bacterium]|nr:ABC transporter permease subunit [Nitriliruptorales bacterium]